MVRSCPSTLAIGIDEDNCLEPCCPGLEGSTRQWLERLAGEARAGPLRWGMQQRTLLRRPPLHHWVERIQVPVGDSDQAISLIRKKLSHTDWASALLGDTLLREAEWYASKVQDVLPLSLQLPCVQVLHGEEQACLLLQDVRPNLAQWRAAGERGVVEALRALAALHAALAQDHCQQRMPWLPTYERFFSTTFVQHRAAADGKLASMPTGRALLAGAPAFEKGVVMWLRSLPPRAREQVHRLWVDPTPVFERLRAIPHTVIHGDPGPQHFGLRATHDGNCIVLIDWEFVALGPPTVDLVHLVLFREFGRIPGRMYRSWAYQRYLDFWPAPAPMLPNDKWQMALDLSTVLWVLAYGQRHGQVLCQVPSARQPQHPAWRALREEASLLEEACKRWLA